MPTLNWLAILVATVVFFFFQAAWFSVFGKAWVELIGKRREDMNPKDPIPYITAAVGSFVNATVLACAIDWIDPSRGWNIGHGIALGAVAALGILGAANVKHYAFSGRPTKLFAIDFGCDLIGFILMGIILVIWR
jgi:hypothetical protein